jgi:Na+/H+-dicarboxylate symporter
MSELLRQSRPVGTGRHMVLFYAIIGGVVAGAILSRLSTGFADLASLVGRVFIAAAVVVSVPLVASQLTLALNNPRERVRRGVNQAKIMVRSLVGAVILLIVSAVTAGILLSGEGAGSVASVIGRLNPEKFMVFGTEGSVMQVLMLSVVGAVLLGALGLRATGAVTFFNRVGIRRPDTQICFFDRHHNAARPVSAYLSHRLFDVCVRGSRHRLDGRSVASKAERASGI